MPLFVHRQEQGTGFALLLTTDDQSAAERTTIHQVPRAALQAFASELIDLNWTDAETRAFIAPDVFVNALLAAVELRQHHAYYGKSLSALTHRAEQFFTANWNDYFAAKHIEVA